MLADHNYLIENNEVEKDGEEYKYIANVSVMASDAMNSIFYSENKKLQTTKKLLRKLIFGKRTLLAGLPANKSIKAVSDSLVKIIYNKLSEER